MFHHDVYDGVNLAQRALFVFEVLSGLLERRAADNPPTRSTHSLRNRAAAEIDGPAVDQVGGLTLVAFPARAHKVLCRIRAAERAREHVVELEFHSITSATAVATHELIA